MRVDISGIDIHFDGTGYHDKNWGGKTVLQSTKF